MTRDRANKLVWMAMERRIAKRGPFDHPELLEALKFLGIEPERFSELQRGAYMVEGLRSEAPLSFEGEALSIHGLDGDRGDD